jgi:hypothetical protein
MQIEKGGIDQHQPVGVPFAGDSAVNDPQRQNAAEKCRGKISTGVLTQDQHIGLIENLGHASLPSRHKANRVGRDRSRASHHIADDLTNEIERNSTPALFPRVAGQQRCLARALRHLTRRPRRAGSCKVFLACSNKENIMLKFFTILMLAALSIALSGCKGSVDVDPHGSTSIVAPQ